MKLIFLVFLTLFVWKNKWLTPLKSQDPGQGRGVRGHIFMMHFSNTVMYKITKPITFSMYIMKIYVIELTILHFFASLRILMLQYHS